MLWFEQLECLGLLHKPYPGTEEAYLEAFSRTVVVDLNDSFQRAPVDFRYEYARILDVEGFDYVVGREFLEKSVPFHRTYVDYQKNANEVYEHKRFFVTDNDRIGLGPVDVKEGDEACLLLGARLRMS